MARTLHVLSSSCPCNAAQIFVPIHKEIHWCLAVIDVKNEKLLYLDSLGGWDRNVLGVLVCLCPLPCLQIFFFPRRRYSDWDFPEENILFFYIFWAHRLFFVLVAPHVWWELKNCNHGLLDFSGIELPGNNSWDSIILLSRRMEIQIFYFIFSRLRDRSSKKN